MMNTASFDPGLTVKCFIYVCRTAVIENVEYSEESGIK